MENKNSEKNHIIGSKVIRLQADEESTMISENIVDDKENTNSSVINKGKNDIAVQEHNDLKTPSSPTGKDLGVIHIKQEKLALNGVESPTEPSATETNTAVSTIIIKSDDLEDKKLKYSAKLAEIGEVREENERLKLLLAQILKDYQSLKSHFFGILRHQEAKEEDELKPKDHSTLLPSDLDHRKECDESDQLLVSLSLGRASSNDNEPRNKSLEKKTSSEGNKNGKDRDDNDSKARDHEGFDKLALALGSSSTSQSFDRDRQKEDDHDQAEPTEIWPPSKVLKRSNGGDGDEDGASQMLPLKKARVSVRTRCDTPTMNDGCQWRKYGQKISKGNPCPRAYYRCTASPTCPVRKQVQRCAEDMSILITTYEGTHNHSLPISATAMASTTAAAASMLQSRSATSSSQLATTSATSASIINNFTSNNPNNNYPLLINNRSVSLSSSSSSIALPSQFYLPNTSISTCNSHPTVTLDLTTLPNPNNCLLGRSSLARYPSTCLSFSSTSSSTLDPPNIMNNINYNSGYSFNYGNVMAQARNYQIGSQLVTNDKQPCQDQVSSFFQPYNNMINNKNANNNDQDSLMTETIAAATKAIAANPKFQSALAAMLTSFAGNGGGGGGSGNGV